MGMDVDSCTHVGVSFVEAWEEDNDLADKLYEVAEELKLDAELDIREPDKISDLFIGVSFKERPTDEEVAAAKKKVKKLLPKIVELMGCKASSDVEIWNVVTITY